MYNYRLLCSVLHQNTCRRDNQTSHQPSWRRLRSIHLKVYGISTRLRGFINKGAFVEHVKQTKKHVEKCLKSKSIARFFLFLFCRGFRIYIFTPAANSSSLFGLIPGGLEGPALVLRALGKGNTELKETDNDGREVLEELVVGLGVALDVGLELLVLNEDHVGGQHHEGLGGLVLVLLGAVPLLPLPLLLDQQAEVVVGQDGGGESPGTSEAGAVSVAAAEGVGARQSDNLLVVEAHAVEDVAEVVGALSGVGQTAVGGASNGLAVATARTEGDDGTLHLLDGGDATEDPEIGVGEPRELGLDGLEEVAGGEQAGVGAVVGLGGEAHGGTVAATSSGGLVKGARCVPGETQQDGTEAAIVVVVLLLEARGNLVVHLLVVGLGRVDNLGRGGGGAAVGGQEVVTQTTGGGSSSQVQPGGRALLGLGLLRGIETTALGAESLAGSRRSSTGGDASELASGRHRCCLERDKDVSSFAKW